MKNKSIISFGEVTVEEVKTLVKNKRCNSFIFFGKRVSTKACILQIIFEQGLSCVKCGIEINRFIVQQHIKEYESGNARAHLAPYHDTRLFTKDHIVPKSKGGIDSKKNYQLMCCKCNGKKQNNLTYTDLRKGHCRNKIKLITGINYRRIWNKFVGLYIKRPIKRFVKSILRLSHASRNSKVSCLDSIRSSR